LNGEFPQVVVPGLLYLGRRMIVSGKPIEGKGLLLTQLACCAATGEEFLGHQIPRPMKVFIADFELMEPQLKQRIEGFIKARADNDPQREKRLRKLINENLRMACYLRHRHWLHCSEAFHDIIRRAWNKYHKSELVILDPGWRLRKSEMIEADIQAFLEGIDEIENTTGASIVYAQHQTKGQQENKAVSERSSGRYDFIRDASTMLAMTNDENTDSLFKVEVRTNDFAQPEPFHILREYPLFRRVSPFELKKLQEAGSPKREATIEDLLRYIPPFMADLDRTGPQEISDQELHYNAKQGSPSMGRDKVNDFKKLLRQRKLIKSVDRKENPQERGTGTRFWSRTKKGMAEAIRH
jgi:hypothetical protein